MSKEISDVFRKLSRPLTPRPTGEAPVLRQLPSIKAVLFDVYGTMFISASGDVGTAMEANPADDFAAALAAIGLELKTDGEIGVQQLTATIQQHHERARLNGIVYPEVNIVDVWRETLAELKTQAIIEDFENVNIERLAVEFEARANPVWPMPNLPDCLAQLRGSGTRLGIISNAQFYTPCLFEALLGEDLETLGFDQRLQFYSYRAGRAKPDCHLYELARTSLASMQIEPAEAVYVGNDMLKDITPAQQVGFRTALFAGDARSLRLRETDERVAGIEPDLILTELSQLIECV